MTASSNLPCCVRSSAHQAAIPDNNRQGQQAKIVDGEADPADRDAAEQCVGLVSEIRIDAPDELDQILEHQERGVGDKHEHDLVAPIHRTQQTALDQEADDGSATTTPAAIRSRKLPAAG